MKISEIQKLGFNVSDIDINVLKIIVDKEFHRTGVYDYRVRAIDKILDLKLSFESEVNTLEVLLGRILQIKCPYCGEIMRKLHSSGNSDSISLNYHCTCKASVNITLASDSIYIEPA